MLTLILKVTNACNLCCRYCSVGDKSETAILSCNDLERALDWFCSHAQKKNEKKVTIILHGGEPMLVPPEQYDRSFARMLEKYGGIEIAFRIQTNGTLLSKPYIELFHKYDFHVGISLDGSAYIHDGQRRNRAGNATYNLIVGNIQKLQSEKLPVSVLMVLTKPALTAGYEYLDLLAEHEIPIKINPLLKIGEALTHDELCLEEGDYGNYLIGLHKYILERELAVYISPLEELQQAVIHEAVPMGCTFHGSCSYKFICINQEGMLYPCGRFADQHSYILGNIYKGITEEGRELQERLNARRTVKFPEKCMECKYNKLCNAGCSASTVGGIEQPSVMCEDYRILFDYLYGEGLHEYKKYLLGKKQEIEEMLSKYSKEYA